MKDKEKQILAITQDLSDCLQYDIEDSSIVDTYDTACRLIDKGWVKFHKDSVVLSKELLEVNDVKSVDELVIISRSNLMAKLELKEKEASKETAEKLIAKIKQSLNCVEVIRGDDTHKLQPDIGYSVQEVDGLLDKIESDLY